MANLLIAPFAGVSPKVRGLTATESDLTTTFADQTTNAFIVVGNNVEQQQVDLINRLRLCLNRLRQTGLARGGSNNYMAKIGINEPSSAVTLTLNAAGTVAETEVAVGYGSTFIPANRAGLSGYVVPHINYLIDFYQERYLKNKTEAA